MGLRRVALNLAAMGAVVLGTICLPFIVAFSVVSDALLIRRLARAPCPRCGVALGRPAVESARQCWQEELRRIRLQNPGVRLRVIGKWELVCANCQSTYVVIPSCRNPATLRPGPAA